MNTFKVFGFILALHVGVISVLFIQPGCQSSVQAPTQSEYQMNALKEQNSSAPSELDLAYQESGILDASLNEETYSVLNEVEGVVLDEDAFTVTVSESNLDTYTIRSGDTLWDLAQQFDTSVAELCELNGLSKDSVLQIGRVIDVPSGDSKELEINKETALSYQPSGYEGVGQSYLIVPGDSLSRIAKKFGTSVDALKAANNLTTDRIYSGQKLLIPVDASSVPQEPVIVEEAPVAITPVEPVASDDSSALEIQATEPLNASATSIEEDLTIIEDFDSEEFKEVGVDFINVNAEE